MLLQIIFSHHSTGATCAHVDQASLEPVEKLMPQSVVTCAELKNDYLLLHTELVAGIIFSDGLGVLSPIFSCMYLTSLYATFLPICGDLPPFFFFSKMSATLFPGILQ